MSVTSPHPMVKNATTASSDPQGPDHTSSNSKDEVSASSDPEGPGHALSQPKAWAPTRPVPRGGLRLFRPPRVGFCLARSLGVGFATGQKQWPQGGTQTVSTTTAWRRTPWSTSRTCPDVTGGRIRPCFETHVVHRVNRPALCCQLPA